MENTRLLRAVERLSRSRGSVDLMETLAAEARGLIGADGITVVLRDGDLCHYADENAISPLWKGRRFPMNTCISGWCMLHRQSAVIPDITTDPRIPQEAYRPTFVKSLAMVPVRSDDPLGALGAYWAKLHRASAGEIAAMEALAAAASVAFANVALISQLEEANRRKDQFIAMFGHELRNPLAAVRNGVRLLQLRQPSSDLEEMLDRQSGHMARLLDDLLDVARITSGKLRIVPETLDLRGTLAEIEHDFTAIYGEAGIRLETDLPPAPLTVRADPVRLHQAIGNLLDNARKFSASGSAVRLAARADAGGNVVVTIADAGRGIEPDRLAEIFELFSQAETHDGRHGLGVGLAIAHSIVELHGGTLTVASEGAGRGSVFTLRLPPAPVERAQPHEARQEPARRLRVLIVEDNVDAADSLKILLQASGHETAAVYSGADGLARAREMKPDVMICDIGMPGMDGYELARHIRSDASLAACHLVALTGYTHAAARVRIVEAGYQAHLAKPVDLQLLLATLQGGARAATAPPESAAALAPPS